MYGKLRGRVHETSCLAAQREDMEMAIAFVFESDLAGEAEYDGLMMAIGRESLEAASPDGFIGHLAGPRTGGGWRVVDIWDAEEAANAF
jgi:hypothetical protein